MNNFLCCVKVLGFAIAGAIVFSGNSTIAQIKQDGNLPNNFGITVQDKIKIIQNGSTKNATDIQNIINRVTEQKYEGCPERQQAQKFLPVMEPPYVMQLKCCMDENGICFKC
ncbi:MAG: hypothetical protein RM338_29635 [Nostoc sp. DedQUE12a]|nr:hypothetical protein [Nostoc sp. DedQUE12a]